MWPSFALDPLFILLHRFLRTSRYRRTRNDVCIMAYFTRRTTFTSLCRRLAIASGDSFVGSRSSA
jgi:hypothetical protein